MENREMNDWTKDSRDFATCLKEWSTAHNGGARYGARKVAAKLLRVEPTVLDHWFDRRQYRHEQSFRLLMTLIDQVEQQKKS